jgi:hypothetical protein
MAEVRSAAAAGAPGIGGGGGVGAGREMVMRGEDSMTLPSCIVTKH